VACRTSPPRRRRGRGSSRKRRRGWRARVCVPGQASSEAVALHSAAGALAEGDAPSPWPRRRRRRRLALAELPGHTAAPRRSSASSPCCQCGARGPVAGSLRLEMPARLPAGAAMSTALCFTIESTAPAALARGVLVGRDRQR
jgi:hypothetical protein